MKKRNGQKWIVLVTDRCHIDKNVGKVPNSELLQFVSVKKHAMGNNLHIPPPLSTVELAGTGAPKNAYNKPCRCFFVQIACVS